MISDAAFKRETDDGYALRGAVFLRTVGAVSQGKLVAASLPSARGSSQQPVAHLQPFIDSPAVSHIIEWVCKSQKHVTRSTFAAELLSAGETIDFGLLLAQMLKEVETGPGPCHHELPVK